MNFASSRRRLQREAHRVTLVLARHDLRHAIDVAGNDMTAKFVADFQSPLQIDPRALPPA